MNRILQAAIGYVESGYKVFPLKRGEKIPDGRPGMAPNGCKDASDDIEQVLKWFDVQDPPNIGLATSNFIVVDVDGKENQWPLDPAQKASLQVVPMQITPKGYHYLFKPPIDITVKNSVSKLSEKVDVRGVGGYIVVSPSIVNGIEYKWNVGQELGDTRPEWLPDCPLWLMDALKAVGQGQDLTKGKDGQKKPFARAIDFNQASEPIKNHILEVNENFQSEDQAHEHDVKDNPKTTQDHDTEPVETLKAMMDSWVDDGNVIGQGGRNASLTRIAGSMRQNGMTRREMFVALIEINRNRCKPPLPVTEVYKIAESISRYEPDQVHVALVEGHFFENQRIAKQLEDEKKQAELDAKEKELRLASVDPGNVPIELLRIPGFVSDVMDFTLATSPYPNKAMAFCGAVALLATLAGRKFRDESNVRTNLYILGLADSGAGKDRSRQVNVEIMQKLGCASMVGSRFASGEGIEDAMLHQPTMLFQTDEIDTMLQSINNSRDGKMESIVFTLLTMYSSSSTVYTMRKKASQDKKKEAKCEEIHQPCLVVYGNAIPDHYYNALSERMVTNGFLSRTLVFESEKRPTGQDTKIMAIPSDIMEQAKYLHTYIPGKTNMNNNENNKSGSVNFGDIYPIPTIIQSTEEARESLRQARLKAEFEYNKCYDLHDTMGKVVWNRVYENIRKLSIVYALSENLFEPMITAENIEACTKIVFASAWKMCYQVATLSADTLYARNLRKVLEPIIRAKGDGIGHSTLLKRTKLMAKEFESLIDTLVHRGDVVAKKVDKPVHRQVGPVAKRYFDSNFV